MTITADFSGGEKTVTTEPLYQWDTGQKLALSGLPATSTDIQVHFANAAMAQAIVKATATENSLPTCDIPNEFLQYGSAAKARAWVFYRASNTEGYTVRTVLIPVTPRKRPNDYVSPTDPDSKGIVEQAIELLESYETDITGKEDVSNKKTTLTGNESSNDFYPTTKAVADALNTKVSRLDIPSTTNLLKGNGSGGISVANPGSDYQPPLVSGTNIKTINNISILGSGNINIEGSGGSSDLIVSDSIGDNALEFVDEQGHVVMLVDNTGAIRTKTFNSSSATNTPSQLTDMVYELHRRTAANTEFPVFSIKGNVLVIGDSTVAGTNVGTKISALMSIASGYTLTDISQGGDTIQGQTGKYNNLSSSVKAAINYAVIQIGLNDVYPASASVADLKTKYQTLVNTIKTNSPNAYIVISCMLPCRARWQALVPTTADHAQEVWAGLNQTIIDNEYGADAVASIHQWALAYDNFVLRPEYDTGDKIHENKAGQQVILLSWLSAMFNNNLINKGGNN